MEAINKKLILGIFVNISFTVLEFIAGILSGSLALVSDAMCNLADTVSLTISFIARLISKRAPDDNKTFGYGRSTILAALLNGLILLSFALIIFYRAYQQFGIAEPIESKLVILVGIIGLIINSLAAFMFIKNRKHDTNINSAFLNMVFDALASLGALISGIIVYFTGNIYVDTIVSCLIGVLILINAYWMLLQVINVLLESVPANLSMKSIKQSILDVDSVKSVNNIHIWAIDSQKVFFTCFISIDCNNVKESLSITKNIKDVLLEKYNIDNATIEIEKCDTTEV